MKRALFVLILMGCGGDDPVEPPPPPFRVTFSQTVNSKGFNPATNREECRFTVAVAASGGILGEFAVWVNYDEEFRYPDGTSNQFFATGAETVDFWGSSRIVTGEPSLVANRINWHPTKKFTLFYIFRYSLMTGEQRSESISINCL